MELRKHAHVLIPLSLWCVLAVPLSADAVTLNELRDMASLILRGLVGFFGAAALGLLGAGFGMYISRLGTENRIEGITIMVWAVFVMFVVMCLAGILMLIE